MISWFDLAVEFCWKMFCHHKMRIFHNFRNKNSCNFHEWGFKWKSFLLFFFRSGNDNYITSSIIFGYFPLRERRKKWFIFDFACRRFDIRKKKRKIIIKYSFAGGKRDFSSKPLSCITSWISQWSHSKHTVNASSFK